MSIKTWFVAKNITCLKNGYKVVRNLNLNLNYGENVILLGPNGSGKSSIVELINRNIYPVISQETFLKIFNEELINIWELRKKISTVNNDIRTRINPNLKVFDLIISGLYGKYCKIYSINERDIFLAENLMIKMNIFDLSHKYFSHLSQGKQQIVLIARALIKKPEILILDEPIAHLDLKSKFYLVDQINELSNINTNILCITHDISIISKIFNRVLLLKDRTIIEDGTQNEIINSQNISNLFDIDINVDNYKGSWNIYRKIK